MIAEMLQFSLSYFATPKEFRQHLKGAVSLWSRGNRCRKTWAEHEENSKRFIAGEIAKLKQKRTCVVLGSGLLRDIPIELLSNVFDTVVLIDIAHLKSARWKVSRLKQARNVKFIHRDLAEIDRLIGAETHLEALGLQAQANEIVPKLISGHIERLKALPCKALLITDISFDAIGHDGKIIQSHDLLFGVDAPQADLKWQWPVAPIGEISKDYSTSHTVIAKALT